MFSKGKFAVIRALIREVNGVEFLPGKMTAREFVNHHGWEGLQWYGDNITIDYREVAALEDACDGCTFRIGDLVLHVGGGDVGSYKKEDVENAIASLPAERQDIARRAMSAFWSVYPFEEFVGW